MPDERLGFPRERWRRFEEGEWVTSCNESDRLPCSCSLDLVSYLAKIDNSTLIVQQECIPQSILGQDVLCQAKSGMGKTAVFVLSTLQQLEPVDGEVSCIILCHTRELAFQIKNEFARFTKYMPTVKTGVFYGGTPVKQDQEILKDKTKCPHIVVGTPGRLNALVRDKALNGSTVKMFVLDECDKMLEALGMFSV